MNDSVTWMQELGNSKYVFLELPSSFKEIAQNLMQELGNLSNIVAISIN